MVLQFTTKVFSLICEICKKFFVVPNLINKHLNKCHEKSFFILFFLKSSICIIFLTICVLAKFLKLIFHSKENKKVKKSHITVFFKFIKFVNLSVFILYVSVILNEISYISSLKKNYCICIFTLYRFNAQFVIKGSLKVAVRKFI